MSFSLHVHEVAFEVVNREGLVRDALTGELTRIKAKFDVPGRFVWHCHIVEHEDNEMMRPYQIGRPY